jgi:hypothetical protein
VDLKVTDSKDHILYQKENAETGKFAFTTDDQDLFEVCFTSVRLGGFSQGKLSSNKANNISLKDPKSHEIKLVIKKGVEAKSYDEQVLVIC